MTITGRLTADAAVNQTKDERRVVNFTVAVNDSYKPKGKERVKTAAFYRCAYWISDKVAQYLKKATLVEVDGRVDVSPYVGKDGTAKASMNCHVSNIKILAWPKEVTVIAEAAPATAAEVSSDDVPF